MSKSSIQVIAYWMIACLFSIFLWFMTNNTKNEQFYIYYSNFFKTLAAWMAAFLCYHTMRIFEHSDLSHKAWKFLGTGLVFWGVGGAIYTFYLLTHDASKAPFPWYSDFGHLMLTPYAIVALIAFRKRLETVVPKWGLMTAILVFVVALGWAFFLNFEGLQEGISVIAYIVTVAYITFDSLLLAMTVATASILAGGAISRPWWFVLTGLFLFYLGDVIYAYLGNLGKIEAWGTVFLDLTWPIAFGLISVAATETRSIFKCFKG